MSHTRIFWGWEISREVKSGFSGMRLAQDLGVLLGAQPPCCHGHRPQAHDRDTMHVCLVAQSCLTLHDPMDCSLPGSSVHWISQARILEQIAISFSGESSQPRDETTFLTSPSLAGRFFTTSSTWEAQTHRSVQVQFSHSVQLLSCV